VLGVHIHLPQLNDELAAVISSVTVRFDRDLSETEYGKFLKSLTGEGTDRHAVVQTSFQLGNRKALIIGLLGVHDLRNQSEESPPLPADEDSPQHADDEEPVSSPFWAHYSLDVLTDGLEIEVKGNDRNEQWLQATECLAGFNEEEEISVTLRLQLAKDVKLPVPLPIDLTSAGIPGFSSIRGVQLFEPDESDPEMPKYYAVIQRVKESTIAAVNVTVRTLVNDDLLIHCMTQSLAVARLAVPTLAQ
jgi:hypothetical protein